MLALKLSILLIYLPISQAKYHNNVFSEELVIKELNNDFVNTYFQFTTQWNYKNGKNDRKLKNNFIDSHSKIIYLHSFTHGFAVAFDIRVVSAL